MNGVCKNANILHKISMPLKMTVNFVCFQTKRSHFSKDTALIQFMEAGTWFIAIFNDREDPQYISFKTDIYGKDCLFLSDMFMV